MAAYAVVDFDMRDPSLMASYVERVPGIIRKFGGRYLARGGKTEILEGSWRPNLIVVLEFPNAEQAKRFFHCEEYKQYKDARQKAGDSNIILVEGVDHEIV
jgi:uncharacterized protein (DUF1330 family)